MNQEHLKECVRKDLNSLREFDCHKSDSFQISHDDLKDDLDYCQAARRIANAAIIQNKIRDLVRSNSRALRRLSSDRWYACESCGEEIGADRLKALPSAINCVDCQGIDEHRKRVCRA